MARDISFIGFSCHPGGLIVTGDAYGVTRPTVKLHDFLFAFRYEVYTIDVTFLSILALPSANVTQSLLSDRKRPEAASHVFRKRTFVHQTLRCYRQQYSQLEVRASLQLQRHLLERQLPGRRMQKSPDTAFSCNHFLRIPELQKVVALLLQHSD